MGFRTLFQLVMSLYQAELEMQKERNQGVDFTGAMKRFKLFNKKQMSNSKLRRYTLNKETIQRSVFRVSGYEGVIGNNKLAVKVLSSNLNPKRVIFLGTLGCEPFRIVVRPDGRSFDFYIRGFSDTRIGRSKLARYSYYFCK